MLFQQISTLVDTDTVDCICQLITGLFHLCALLCMQYIVQIICTNPDEIVTLVQQKYFVWQQTGFNKDVFLYWNGGFT